MKILLLASLMVISSCSFLRRDRTPDFEKYRAGSGHPVFEKMSAENVTEKFVKEICKDEFSAECEDKYFKMVHAKMSQHYEGARAESVIKYCDANPLDCRLESNIEALYKQSHNHSVDQALSISNEFGTSAEEEWADKVSRIRNGNPASVNHYHYGPSPAAQVPVYRNQNYHPQMNAPKRYNSTCNTYAYGTVCDTTER